VQLTWKHGLFFNPLYSGDRLVKFPYTAKKDNIKSRSQDQAVSELVCFLMKSSGCGRSLPPPIPAKGWAEMTRKAFEVNPLTCPRCGGTMKVISFLTDYAVVDRIINHLKLTFFAERTPSCRLSGGPDGCRVVGRVFFIISSCLGS